MKLTDLDTKQTTVIAKALKEHYDLPLNFEKLSYGKTKAMLTKVKGLISEAKQDSNFYESQNNPNYLKLVFMEQGLTKHLAHLSTRIPRIVVENEEVEKSQVVLAAQDMVDSVQKMVEEASDMLVKELPALVDSIQSEIGVNESEQFNQQATEALTSLQAALTQSKGTLQGALNSITGQGGAATAAFGGEMAGPPEEASGEEVVDTETEIEEPAPEMPAEEPEEIIPAVGRAKR